LAAEAGASDLLRRAGWIRLYRTAAKLDTALADAQRWRQEFGVDYRALDAQALRQVEPDLRPVLAGGIHWTQPTTVSDPQALAAAYLRRFAALGGRFVRGDAATLQAAGG